MRAAVRVMPWWLRVAVVTVGTLGLLIGLLWIFQRRLIYLPDSSPVPAAGQVVPGAVDITLHTADGLDLGAWYAPPQDGSCRPTVLIANGNAGNRNARAPLAKTLMDNGFGVLLFDYRGYGGNPGAPSEDGLAADVRSAHRYLTVDAGIAERELIYFGESLGAGVVSGLATEHPPAGLVLRSPFADLAAAAQVHYPFLPVRLLLRDHFPVTDDVAVIEVPTTVIYGTSDTVIPPQQSLAVAGRAAGDIRVAAVPGADHNDRALLDGPELIAAVAELAERAGCPPGR